MAPVSAETKGISRLMDVLFTLRLENTTVGSSMRFVVNGQTVGIIRQAEWELLKKHTGKVFEQQNDEIHLNTWKTPKELTEGIGKILAELRTKDVFPCLKGWRNELYDVAPAYGDPVVFQIERAATFIFGTKRYGVDVNGFVEDSTGRVTWIWLQKRARQKELFPGMLDIYVSGGLASGETPLECMYKECSQEASLSRELSSRLVRPASSVSFLYEDKLGIHPEITFCYDAHLPADHVPAPSDGEVEEFIRFSVATSEDLEALFSVLGDATRFKPTSVPTILDFLIRRGLVDDSLGGAFFDIFETIHQPLYRTYPPSKSTSQ